MKLNLDKDWYDKRIDQEKDVDISDGEQCLHRLCPECNVERQGIDP